MSFFLEVAAWLTDPTHWQGSDGIPIRVLEHVAISFATLGIASLIAFPMGLFFGHTRRGGEIVINVANIGRAIPSLAILSLSLPLAFGLGLGLGFGPTVLALVPLGIPPILINTYTAIREVDPDIVEAARGMGMRSMQVLFQAELPAAAPLIIGGIRTAAVTIVATATLGALVASGGLGRYIVDGLARQEQTRLFVGAMLVALTAIGTEVVFGMVERAVVSPGIRVRRDRLAVLSGVGK